MQMQSKWETNGKYSIPWIFYIWISLKWNIARVQNCPDNMELSFWSFVPLVFLSVCQLKTASEMHVAPRIFSMEKWWTSALLVLPSGHLDLSVSYLISLKRLIFENIAHGSFKPGCTWLYLAVSGCTWRYLAVAGSIWLYLALPRSAMIYLIIDCHWLA